MALVSDLVSRFRRHWLSAVLFLIPVSLYFLAALVWKLSDIYQHILLTLTAVMGIHVLDRLFLIRDTEEALGNLVNGIRTDISKQTSSLRSSSDSLDAMLRCGIIQIYPSRERASKDIRENLTNSSNSKIWLIGISLNDFVQGMDRTLGEAWETIQEYVLGYRSIDAKKGVLDIRVLLIDPGCIGARLRSEAESQSYVALRSRLETEVRAAAEALYDLQSKAASEKEKPAVSFQCRLYRLPPILFLCWMDSICYVQQYHFWTQRKNDTPIPVLKFRRLAGSSEAYPYHEEMENHFKWIWENASISVEDYVNGIDLGTDEGINQCGAVNVFTDQKTAKDRIKYILKNTKENEKVSIQGISLSSFLIPGELFEAITNLVEDGKVDLEVLLLDPEKEQAKYRSYRERLFGSPEQSYNDYVEKKFHERSKLYHDTYETIENIRNMIQDVAQRKGSGWKPRLKVGLYDSAPACFVLRAGNQILTEQYHYGKIAGGTHAILGKDMPLFEYSKSPSKLYARRSDPLRRPFDLLVDHLDYAFRQSENVELFSITPNPG
jgi:hypothetical protein